MANPAIFSKNCWRVVWGGLGLSRLAFGLSRTQGDVSMSFDMEQVRGLRW